jgi:quercetin dioxygenase-like cupin family protein
MGDPVRQPDGISEIVVNPLDAVSVPKGVTRGFKNISDSDAVLLVIFGAPRGDAGHVQWMTKSSGAPRRSATP